MKWSRRGVYSVVMLMASIGLFACGPEEGPPRPGSVEGTVTLSGSEDASGVTVEAGDISTQTSADGSYVLAGLAPGELTLTARTEGYKPNSQKVTVEEARATTVDIELERKNLEPTFESVTLNPEQLQPGGEASLDVSVSDANGDEVSLTYKATGGFVVEARQGAEAAGATVKAPEKTGVSGKITVEADDGNGGTAQTTVEVETVSNTGPRIENLQVTPRVLTPGGTALLQVSAADADEDKLTYKWEAPEGWELMNGDQLQAQITAPDTFEATAEVTVTVTDELGETDTAKVSLRTKSNEGPMISGVEAAPPQVKPGGTLVVKVEASDPEGKPLSISWSGPADWRFENTNKKLTRVTAPDEYGETATLNVRVTDSEMEETVGTVIVSTPENNGPVIDELNVQPTTVAKGGDVVATVNASDPNGDELSYKWSVQQPWAFKGASNTARTVVEAPDTPGVTGIVQVTVTDTAGKSATATETVSTQVNRPPVIAQLVASQTSLAKKGTANLAVSATDADGDTLKYNWSISPTPGWSLSGQGANVQVTAPDAYGQSATVKLTVIDNNGGSASSQLFLKTVDNATPTIKTLLVNPKVVSRSGTIQAEALAEDPNGDALSYQWTISSKAKWTVKGNGAKATVTPPNVPSSSATLKVTVSDGSGGTNTAGTIVETEANTPPVITTPATDLELSDAANPSPISHSRAFDWQIKADDADGDNLTYSVRGAPGAKIGKKGELVWKPTRSQKGSTYTAIIEVSDGFDTVSRQVDMKIGGYAFEATNPTTMQEPDGMAFGDFNGDSRIDIMRVDDRGDYSADIEVALGTKSGFKVHKHFSWDKNARNCASPAVGDLDGDKDLDAIIACDRGASSDDDDISYYVWENDGKANFSKGERGYWNVSDGHWVGDIEVGDLDGDGDLDAAVVGDEVVLVSPNNGKGKFNNQRDYNNSNCWEHYSLEIAQMRKGGNPELVVGAEDRCVGWRNRDEGRIQIWDVKNAKDLGGRLENDDLGRGREYLYGLGVTDLDGDGDNDVAVLDDDANQLMLFEGDDNANLNKVEDTSHSNNPPPYRQTSAIQFADMDGDGNTDIITGTRKNRHITIYFTDGNVRTTRRTDVALPSNRYSGDVYGVFVKDWDGNGDPDVLFAESGGKIGIAY